MIYYQRNYISFYSRKPEREKIDHRASFHRSNELENSAVFEHRQTPVASPRVSFSLLLLSIALNSCYSKREVNSGRITVNNVIDVQRLLPIDHHQLVVVPQDIEQHLYHHHFHLLHMSMK
jgi:hypothetical protein